MKIKFSFSFVFIVLAVFASCNKDTTNIVDEQFITQDGRNFTTPYGSFTLSENAVFLNDKGDAGITVIDTITLSVQKRHFNDTEMPQKGNILLYTNTGNKPSGLLGRVINIDDNEDHFIFHTSSVSLDDVFDQIDLDINVPLPDDIGSFTDEEGNELMYQAVDNSVWDSLDGYALIEKEDFTNTKSKLRHGMAADGKISHTYEFKIKSGVAKGTFYIGIGVTGKINKSKGKPLECSFDVSTCAGVKGKLTLKKFEKKIPFIKLKTLLPVDIVVPPLILTPELRIEGGTKPYAEVSLETELKYELFSSVTHASFNNGKTNFSFESGPKADSYFKVISLEGEAGIGVYSNVSIDLDMYGMRSILAIGSEAEVETKFEIKGDISLNDKLLLESNPKISIKKERFVGSYLYSEAFKLFGAEDGKFSLRKKLDCEGNVSIFPEHVNNYVSKANSLISVLGKGKKTGLTDVKEHGYALFHKKEVVKHQNLFPATSKASISDSYTEFDFSGLESEYSIKEYVKVENTEGDYYCYKNIVKKVKTIAINEPDLSQMYTLNYNEDGQLVSAICNYRSDGHGTNQTYTYSQNLIIGTDDYRTHSFSYNEAGQLDNYSENDLSNSYVYSDEGKLTSITNTVKINDKTYTTIYDVKWSGNNIASVTAQSQKHYISYSEILNPLNINIEGLIGLPIINDGFLKFNGISSQYLPSSITSKYYEGETYEEYTVTHSYTLDDDGYPTKINMGQAGSVSLTYYE